MKSCDAEDDAAEAAALAVDVLGRRIDDEVGAELERRWKIGVANTLSTISFAPAAWAISATAGDVDHLERRVGGRLEEERLGVRPHRRAPGVEIGAVDEGDSTPKRGSSFSMM